MRTTVGSSRIVGVWAASQRATPTRTSVDSSDPSGHASAWRTPASYTWNQWKPASSRSRAWPRAAITLGRCATAAQVAGDDRAGPVDLALDVPHGVQLGEVAGVAGGQPRRRHVQEPVEVDAQRAVQQRRGAARATAGGPAPGGARWPW